MYRPVLVAAPTIKPVTLEEAKAHCRVDHADDDIRIAALIAAATAYADGWTGILGRCLVEQTWRQDYDGFVCWSRSRAGRRHRYYGQTLRLPLFPVISASSVKYTDAAGVEQTIGSGNYTLQNDDLGAYIEFATAYTTPMVSFEPASVRVAYLAGYANAGTDPNFTSTVPDPIKQGLLLLISHWYENRDAVVTGSQQPVILPMAVDALFGPYRRTQF